jgi:hypothetical protein
VPETWRPALVALDIDGTLLIPDFEAGFSAEQTTQPVAEAVLAAARAGRTWCWPRAGHR